MRFVRINLKKFIPKPVKISSFLVKTYKEVLNVTSFIFMLVTYLTHKSINWIISRRIFPPRAKNIINKKLDRVCNKIYTFNNFEEQSINRINLIELALQNMKFKPARTLITVGGMSVGIGIIVFLVSIGYGLQNLVISRVARLDELKQADVSIQVGSQKSINDGTLNSFSEVSNVKHVLPMIALVGKVNYKNSVADAAVFGVTTDYLSHSAVRPTHGSLFESNNISVLLEEKGEVAGLADAKVTFEQEIGEIDFRIDPGVWLRVREGPDTESEIIGYTRRVEGIQQGKSIWGSSYLTQDNDLLSGDGEYGKWIESDFYIWEAVDCSDDENCEDGRYKKVKNSQGSQEVVKGYVAQIGITIDSLSLPGQVLGAQDRVEYENLVLSSHSSSDESYESSDEELDLILQGDGEFVEIIDEGTDPGTKRVNLGSAAVKQAVVNRAMLRLMSLEPSDAIGESFEVSFIVVGELTDENQKIESNPTKYEIVGVSPDGDTPFFYVPLIDIKTLGVNNYSQAKIVVEKENQLGEVRQKIESMGFTTNSVVDTVDQIDSLFATARLILASIGLVALSVAGLGMFNTMSVSLLERIREIGLMKAMGMKSREVRELFLTESMMMGFLGGVIGIILGVVAGKGLSLFLSIFTVARGVGYIDISYLPPMFTVFIIVLSTIVGLVTGIYPARRATKISALDALRYE